MDGPQRQPWRNRFNYFYFFRFIEEPLPIIKETAVVLDDSDEEDGAKTDSSIESEMEFELEDSQNVEDLIQGNLL